MSPTLDNNEFPDSGDELLNSSENTREFTNKGQQIVDEAAREAQDLIRQAMQLSSQAKRDIEARLLAASRSVEDETRRSIDQIFVQHSQIVSRISDELIAESKRQMEDMKQHLEETATASLEATSKELLKKSRQVDVSLEEYANLEKKRIASELQKRVPEILNELLGKSISIEEHEQLIEDRLDEAIKDLTG